MQANQEAFRTDEITQQNAQGYRDAVFGQLVGAFGDTGAVNRSGDVLVAAGRGFSGLGLSGSGNDPAAAFRTSERLYRTDVQTVNDFESSRNVRPSLSVYNAAAQRIGLDDSAVNFSYVGNRNAVADSGYRVGINAGTAGPTTGSSLLDEGLQRATGTLLGPASLIHGAAKFARDQGLSLANALSGGELAQSSSTVQEAVQSNAALGQALLNLPGQVSRFALRAATGNFSGFGIATSSALHIDEITSLNAGGDYLGAQVLTTQSALNVAGVVLGGAGVAKAGIGFAESAKFGVQLMADNFAVSNLGVNIEGGAYNLLSRQGFLLNAVDQGGGLNGAGIVIHKNSLVYVGDTHVYRIIGPEGTSYKVGESAQGLRVTDGASIRAEQQVRALQRETGEIYKSEILRSLPDKASARQYETQLIERFRRIYGANALPGNKTNR